MLTCNGDSFQSAKPKVPPGGYKTIVSHSVKRRVTKQALVILLKDGLQSSSVGRQQSDNSPDQLKSQLISILNNYYK